MQKGGEVLKEEEGRRHTGTETENLNKIPRFRRCK